MLVVIHTYMMIHVSVTLLLVGEHIGGKLSCKGRFAGKSPKFLSVQTCYAGCRQVSDWLVTSYQRMLLYRFILQTHGGKLVLSLSL